MGRHRGRGVLCPEVVSPFLASLVRQGWHLHRSQSLYKWGRGAQIQWLYIVYMREKKDLKTGFWECFSVWERWEEEKIGGERHHSPL